MQIGKDLKMEFKYPWDKLKFTVSKKNLYQLGEI